MAEPVLVVDGGQLGGEVRVPGDKSISHRAALLAAMAQGVGTIEGFLDAADTLSLLDALRALGVRIERPSPGVVRIHGRGNAPFDDPARPLDCGNSGTALRLLAGVLAGRGTRAVLTGDASLSRRPMARIVEPLRLMGAAIDAPGGTAPVTLGGGRLTGRDITVAVASAQVESCLLFAGLHAEGTTRVALPAPARDHTQRLLRAYGIETTHGVTRCDWDRVGARTVRIPGDPSAAAFFAVGAALVPGSEIRVRGIGANPLRTGFVRVLERMGAEVSWAGLTARDGEPVGDLTVRGVAMRGTRIAADEIPGLMDELPALLVAAAFAEGTTVVTGAAELRHKESDRLATVGAGLEALGARVVAGEDGLAVTGGGLHGGTVDAHHDHRVAMAFAVAGLRVPIRVRRAAGIASSYPGFADDMRRAGLEIE